MENDCRDGRVKNSIREAKKNNNNKLLTAKRCECTSNKETEEFDLKNKDNSF